MNARISSPLLCWLLAAPSACVSSPAPDAEAMVQLPGGEPGIGLDDLRFSPALGRLVVAAGRTGRLDLVDPTTFEVTSIAGFTAFDRFDGGDQQGVESADESGGLIYAVDRAAFKLDVVDPAQRSIVASTQLDTTEPDYVRVSAARSEVWISNVNRSRVEVLTAAGAAAPVHAAFIAASGGPEGLAIDDARQRVYARAFSGDVIVIDAPGRVEVARWSTGCSGAHGIPIVDPDRPFVYVGCSDATVVVLAADIGTELGRFTLGPGPSIIAYAPALHHLYLRGDGFPAIVELSVSAAGELAEIDRFSSTPKGHCMATDDDRGLWVCDRSAGRLLRFRDVQP